MPAHKETRYLPYSPEQMFKLVYEVELYPEFLPWCRAARIHQAGETEFTADLIIGFKMIQEKFTSKVMAYPTHRIDVTYIEGPFRYLTNQWNFKASDEGGCRIDFYLDFEFRSKTLQKLIGLLFSQAVQRMVSAFEARAHALYAAGISTNSKK